MSKKILLIDDDRVNVNMIKTKLIEKGYDVIVAFDGEEGLARLHDDCPNLVLLDIEMPNKDGYTFMIDVHKDESFKNIPVIVLTSHTDLKPIFELKGVKEYLVKPVNISDLIQKINQYIG